MNRIEHDLWLMSIETLCTECDDECAGAEKCVMLAEWVAAKKNEQIE